MNAQYTRGLFETKLAQALIKTGRIEEARALLLTSGKILSTVLERDGSLRTEYAVGLNAVRLGELYAQLANTSRNGPQGRTQPHGVRHRSRCGGVSRHCRK